MKTENIFDVGDFVCCDLCNTDYTESDERGGFLFGGKGVCPKCMDRFYKEVKKHNEEEYIEAWAQPGESFRDFILRIRNGDNTVKVISEE